MRHFLLVLALIMVECGALAATQSIAVIIKNAKGDQVGDATITPDVKGVKLVMNVKSLPPGLHAVHFHEFGSCIGPDFKSAGGHFAPGLKKHGRVAGGPHAGDMENFEVRADGTGHAELLNTMVTLEKGPTSLLEKGTSIVIHANRDDHVSQPAGNAGDRIACGEIKGAP